ncbi:MAG: glucose-1-phosphate adenylyltransferase [Gammaproteobacteria bacterium]|nr:glucose-1-phosphate adenylyltransferase [Gammaproteobacteria bacterium]
MLADTITFLLAGGIGSRLHPLTSDRAKPAVPFGGKYRIIDFTLTNCLHSGLRRVLVLTQYKSHSLNKHLRDGWSIFNPELGEFITAVPPQMRIGENWYLGTADAIYQNLYILERSHAKWVLILSGDHIYRMDYAPMISYHIERNADVTLACMELPKENARQFGIVTQNATDQIIKFTEKPAQPDSVPSDPNLAQVSMGIYVFSYDVLMNALKQDHADSTSGHDFGKNIIPSLVNSSARVFGYRFGGELGRVSPDRYWRDVGTLDSYYEANMDLLKPIPPMNLYQHDWPIRTYSGQYPPARNAPGEYGTEGISINSIICSGVIISGGLVQASILFNNVTVHEEAQVENSLLFEGVVVGKGAKLKNCIVEKNVTIPERERIGYNKEHDARGFTLSDKGIVVVPKGFAFTDP